MKMVNTLRSLFLVATLASSQALIANTAPSVPAEPAGQSAVAIAEQFAKVNINTAGADGLTSLLGVGPSKAEAIVKYRDKFGRFKTREDLLAVDGIGQSTLSKNRDRIDLE